MVISMAKKTSYGNNDIVALKGPDQVRKRPAVIFGSDGLEGCQHSVFEILSNSIDEAREGFGDKIIITRFLDKSVEIQDFGRGIPVDYNEKEKNYNWFLVFCTFMQAASTIRTTAAAMNILSDLTVSDFAQLSSLRSTWRPRFTVTAGATSSISKRARLSARWKRKSTPRGTQAHA